MPIAIVPSVSDPAGRYGAIQRCPIQSRNVTMIRGTSRRSALDHAVCVSMAALAAFVSKGCSATRCTRAINHAAIGIPAATTGRP